MADDIETKAAAIGREHGKNAAGWTYDGNTAGSWYSWMLKGIENGDPEVLDSLRTPDLSGEYADDYTPARLAKDLEISEESDPDGLALNDACDAYQDAASEAFWGEIERVCREHVSN